MAIRIAHATRSTETAMVGHVGASRVSSDLVVAGSGNQAQTLLIAANDIGPWAFFFDGMLDFRWYARDVSTVHRTGQPLDPLVNVFVGARHNQRFHRAGDLSPFNDPTGRLVFGFEVNPIRVTDGNTTDRRTWFTVGGGVEFDGAIRATDRLPSGFRAVLVAKVDLVTLARHAGR
jgi:hypothetical protein